MVDQNFALISNAYGLNLPVLTSLNSDTIPAGLQQNSDATEAALCLNLYPVAGSADPEAATQANFEIINSAWHRREAGGNPANPGGRLEATETAVTPLTPVSAFP